MGKCKFPKSGLDCAVVQTGFLYDVANFHIGRAGDFAPLAVEAVFKCLIVEGRVLEAVPLPIGAGLFGTGKVRIYSQHRTVHGADRAFHTLFEIVFACIVFHFNF